MNSILSYILLAILSAGLCYSKPITLEESPFPLSSSIKEDDIVGRFVAEEEEEGIMSKQMIEAEASMVRGGARKVIGFYKQEKERGSVECLEALGSSDCSPRTILDLSDLAESPHIVDTLPLAPTRELEISEISMGSEIPILLADIIKPFRSPNLPLDITPLPPSRRKSETTIGYPESLNDSERINESWNK
jgi:hypothetical protein